MNGAKYSLVHLQGITESAAREQNRGMLPNVTRVTRIMASKLACPDYKLLEPAPLKVL